MTIFTRAYWIFWLFFLPVAYWPNAIDYEFPKFIVLLAAVNCWGILYILKTKNNFLEAKNTIDLLIIGTGLVSLASWIVNGFGLSGLLGEDYRYQGLITIFSLIEWYLLSKKMLISDKIFGEMLKGVGFGLTSLAIFWPLMGNPNFIAAYLVLLSTLTGGWSGKFGSGIITWITGSRSAGLAWLFSFLLITKKRILVIGIVIIGVSLIYFFPRKLPSTFDNRPYIWEKSIELILRKPIFGWGPENFETGFKSVLKDNDFDLKNIRVDRAHNIFLDVTANTGLVGLLVWLILFYWLFINGLRQEKIFLIAFLIISSLNVININTWLLFYLISAKISQSLDKKILL